MTVSSNKNSRDKRYRIDSRFMDADRNEIFPDAQDDEDAIDRLLVHTDFDGDYESASQENWDAALDDPAFWGEFNAISEQPPVQKVETVPVINPIELFSDETIRESDLIEMKAIRHENDRVDLGVEVDSEQPRVDEKNGTYQVPAISLDKFISEQYLINQHQEQLTRNIAVKLRKLTVLNYAVLIVCIAALGLVFSSAMTVNSVKQEVAVSAAGDSASRKNDVSAANYQGHFDASDNNDSPLFKPLSQASKNNFGQTNSVSIPENQSGLAARDPIQEAGSNPKAPNNLKPTWFVNLVSFKQRIDAVNQASEFIHKGILADIVEVEIDHAAWYRLRVGGFASKEQALAYAEKIKRPLKLDSVWIASS